MPPQLSSRIRPNISFSLTANGFDQRPEVAQGIAQCIAYWSWVETQTGRLFLELLGSNESAGAALYNSLESDRAKDAAMHALALTLDQEDGRLIDALLRLIKSRKKIRDKIAHWFWGLSPDLLDAMVLVNPKFLITHSALMSELLRAQKPIKNTDVRIPDDEVYVYRAKDLQADATDFSELATLINRIRSLCGVPNIHVRAALRDELANDARLAEFLDR